jgi:Na+/H+-dicarboxylate symporter
MAGAAMCGIAGAACGIAMGAAGAPPRGPCGSWAIAEVVETERTKTAAIAARCRCRDMIRTPHNVLI